MVVVAACGGNGGGDTATATIGPEGGTVRLDGFVLSVPPSALTTPTELTVRRMDIPVADLQTRSPVFQLEPEGLTFRRPVGVAIRTDDAPTDAHLFWTDADGVLRGHAGRRGPDHLSASGRHFSRVVVGIRAACLFPSLRFTVRPIANGRLLAVALTHPHDQTRADVTVATLGAGDALGVEAIDALTGSTRVSAAIPSVVVTGPVRIAPDGVVVATTAGGLARVVVDRAGPATEVSAVPFTGGVAALAVGDVDGDARADAVVVSALPSRTVTVYTVAGSSYALPQRTPRGDVPVAVTVVDFNSDGTADVLVTEGSTGAVQSHLFAGAGDGTFGAPLVIPLGAVATTVATATPDAIAVEVGGTSSSFAGLAPTPSDFAPTSSLLVPGAGGTPAWMLAPGGASAALGLTGSLAAMDVDGDGARDLLGLGVSGVFYTRSIAIGPRPLATVPGNFVEDSDGDDVINTTDTADGDGDLFVVGGTSAGEPAVMWARPSCESTPMIDAPFDAPLTDAPFDAIANPWSMRTSGTADGLEDIAWDGTRYLALSRASSLYQSADGITWAPATASGLEMFLVGFGIAYSPPLDRWVLVGDQSFDGRIYTSEGNAGAWTLRGSPPERTRTVIWAGPPISRFVLGTDSDIRTSVDGITWTTAAGSTGVDIFDIAWAGPGRNLVAVGRNGAVRTSPDATTWTAGTPPVAGILRDVTGHDDVFVTVTDSSPSIFQSTNGGGTFTDTGSLFTAGAVAWTGSRFDGFIFTNALPIESADGVTWTAGSSFSGQTVVTIIADGPRIVAVGSGGLIATREF